MRTRHFFLSLMLLLPLWLAAQTTVNQEYKEAFEKAYQACPEVPQGWLEAVSFTNTQCHHLTDADYFHDDANAMPRAYGLMGLVKDGKNYFRENLHLVSELSGVSEAEILASPTANVMAYAMAFERLMAEDDVKETKDYLSVIQQLSELPIGEEKDIYPMQSMFYSVCVFLNDAEKAVQFGFPKHDIDLKAVFGDDLIKLTSPCLVVSDSFEGIDTLTMQPMSYRPTKEGAYLWAAPFGMTCLQKPG